MNEIIDNCNYSGIGGNAEKTEYDPASTYYESDVPVHGAPKRTQTARRDMQAVPPDPSLPFKH